MWRWVVGNLRFEAAHVDLVDELMADLRPLDKQEVEAASGDLRTSLVNAVRLSNDPVAARLQTGELVAVFGVAALTLVSRRGSPWLLGTTLMAKHPREVLATAHRYIAFVREHYPQLVNYVDARNRPSIRWLRSVGFEIEPAAPFGVQGLPFHRFSMGLIDV